MVLWFKIICVLRREVIKNTKRLLGKRIKELRVRKNISQRDLAQKAGIEHRSLSHVECGDNFPSKSLINIAEALDVSLAELFDFDHLALTKREMLAEIKESLPNLDYVDIKTLYDICKAHK